MGYPIEGVELEGEGGGGEAEQPIAVFLAKADAAKGEAVFKKCAACHNADQGGAHALGPNVFGIMGAPVAAKPGYAYSDALKSKGGTWDWETMSAWLANPKKFAQGTKMTFAGLGNPQDRADLMAWLNTKGSNLPLPAAPAAPAEQTDDAAPKPGSGTNDGAQPAENEPVLNEQQTGSNPKNVGGPGASNVTGPSGRDQRQ
jgi:cytochrome c